MDQVCARCTRRAINRYYHLTRNQHALQTRQFSSSELFQDQQAKSTSDGKLSTPSKPTARDTTSKFGAFIAQAVKDSNNPSGQVLRRTRPSYNANPKTSPSPDSLPGQLLRRTGPPRSGSLAASARSNTPRSASQSQSQTQGNRRRRTSQSRRPTKYDDTEDNAAEDEEMERYIKKIIDPPANPTEPIPYKPQAMTIDQLRADWPDTPLSTTGLVESVQQRIEHLARRIPHGYITPEQLAERYHSGEFIRFESTEERDKVLQIAEKLAKDRAGELTERKGEEVQSANMAFDDLSSNNTERSVLVNTMVKGIYSEPSKQKMPFLDNVVRNLRNNSTYGSGPTDKFMARIQGLMPPSATKGSARRQQKSV